MDNSRRKIDFKGMGLSDKDIEVMSMYFYDAKSLREIGQLQGVHKQTVKDRLSRCERIFKANKIPLPKRLFQPEVTGPIVYMDPVALDGWIAEKDTQDEE